VFSVYSSEVFDFLNDNKEILDSLAKSISKFHIFSFISEYFCQTMKGFEIILIIFLSLIAKKANSRTILETSVKSHHQISSKLFFFRFEGKV
jgi:hypothetical protein